jgi:outer membrane protein assembly factor BamB
MKALGYRTCSAGALGWLLMLGLAMPAAAQVESYFRRDAGLAADDQRALPDALADEQLVWREPLPAGHSTPLVVGDRILLTAHQGSELLTICLDRASGKLLWKQAVAVERVEKVHPEGSPAAASCACDGRRVHAFFGSYGLVCYDLAGTPLWSKRLGPFRDEFGAASSPILVDGKLILNEDHDLDSFILALRADTGDVVWQTPRDGFTRSYATPVVWQVGGRRQLVVAGTLQLMAYDPADGRPLWSLDGFARIVNTTPTLAGDLMFVCTWSPGGDSDARIGMEPWETALAMWDKNTDGKLQTSELPAGEVRARFFRIDLDSDQALDESEWSKYARLFELAENTLVALKPGDAGGPPQVVWQYRRGLPYVPSPLVYRGRVFLIKDGGIVTVLDAASGKLVKQARGRGEGNYYASPVAGDGKIYTASGQGVVTIFAAGNKAEVLSSRDFDERIAATPVLADGRVYVRTEKALYCFGAK